ncbi:MAG: maltose ABC transporter substrate-binding protein [Turicibacter sp.]
MRKSISMLFMGLALVVVTACGNEKVKDDRTVVKIWMEDSLAEVMVPTIEEKFPHIKVVVENVGATDARAKLELDGPAGTGADVFYLPHDGMAPGAEANILLPIGENLTAYLNESMLDASRQTVVIDGVAYGVPISTESIALFYNKTLLDENGFTVAGDWSDIVDQARIYNDVPANKLLMRWETGNSYSNYFFLTAAGYELFGPNHDDASLVNFNTPAVIEGLTAYGELKEILPVPSEDLNWDTVHGEFVKGNVPYMITGPWSIEEVKQGGIDNGFEWGVTTIPTVNGKIARTFSGNIIACISAYTKVPTEARQVLEFISSTEGLQVMYDQTAKLPALKDMTKINGLSEDPYLMGIAAQAQNADPMPLLPEMAKYWDPAAIMYKSVWEGLATPEQAAAKAQTDYEMTVEITK